MLWQKIFTHSDLFFALCLRKKFPEKARIMITDEQVLVNNSIKVCRIVKKAHIYNNISEQRRNVRLTGNLTITVYNGSNGTDSKQ